MINNSSFLENNSNKGEFLFSLFRVCDLFRKNFILSFKNGIIDVKSIKRKQG